MKTSEIVTAEQILKEMREALDSFERFTDTESNSNRVKIGGCIRELEKIVKDKNLTYERKYIVMNGRIDNAY